VGKYIVNCDTRHNLFSCKYFLQAIIIIMIFYCGLMVHTTDKRAQKVFCCTSAHITETVLAHDQHWEGANQFILFTAVSSFAKAQKMDNHTVGHYTTGVSTCPALRRARPIPALLTILCLVCTQCPHTLLHKSNTGETQTPKQFTDNYCICSPGVLIDTNLFFNFSLRSFGQFTAY